MSWGTHCVIMEEFDEGYRGIYCHFNGFIINDFINGGVGYRLVTYYNSKESARNIIDLGILISLDPNIRDTKERIDEAMRNKKSYDDVEFEDRPFYGYTIDDVVDHFKDKNINYVYIWTNGHWYVDVISENLYSERVDMLLENNKELLTRLNKERMGK